MTAKAALQFTTADIRHVTGYTPNQQNQYYLRDVALLTRTRSQDASATGGL
jgi:hypothetical protein